MKVLLVQPGTFGTGSAFPPIGLLSLAAVLRQAGHDVHFHDASALEQDMDKAFERVRALEPDVLGMSLFTVGLPDQYAFLRRVKEACPKTAVLVGGPHASALPQPTLQECPEADYLVFGEGERTVLDVMKAIASNGPPDPIAGCAFQRDGGIVMGPPRELIADLDELPFPAMDLSFDGGFRYYRRTLAGGGRTASMTSSRGCPFNCTFCFKATWGTRFRHRSPHNVVSEMRRLIEELHVEEIHFVDDLFTLKRDWLYAFFEEIRRAGISIPWRCLLRADILEKDDYRELYRHGCRQVEIGVETGDLEVMADIGKKVTHSQILHAVRWAQRAGLTTLSFFMFGHRIETPESAKRTLCFARKLRSDVYGVSCLLPFPGTQVYEDCLPEEFRGKWEYFSPYYGTERPPLSVCSMDSRDLLRYRNQANAEACGNLRYLATSLLATRFDPLQRSDRLTLWRRHASEMIAIERKKERILREGTFFAGLRAALNALLLTAARKTLDFSERFLRRYPGVRGMIRRVLGRSRPGVSARGGG